MPRRGHIKSRSKSAPGSTKKCDAKRRVHLADFLIFLHFHVVGPPFQKCTFLMLLTVLTCSWTSENFDCYLKMGKHFFMSLTPAKGGNVFFDFFKATNEEKLKK